MTTLSKTTHFEGWEAAARQDHVLQLSGQAAFEICETLRKGTQPGVQIWSPNQRYELVVTLREVPTVQAGSTVSGAGLRSGKTITVDEIAQMKLHSLGLGLLPGDPVSYPVGLGPGDVETMLRPPKCECGANATGGGGHSKWCPLHVLPESP